MKNIFAVIPAFNEEKVIRGVVNGVLAKYPNVVVVDDASSDRTLAVAQTTKAHVLSHLINRGQGATLRTGIDYALQLGADIIVTFDSDGQHSVDDIASLIAPIAEGGYDVALGSRFLGHTAEMPRSRRFILRAATLFTRAVSNLKVTDTHNGLRGFSRHAAQTIRITQDRFSHASEILEEIAQHELRYTEVPVHIAYTDYSLQKGQRNGALVKIAIRFLLSKIRQ